MNSMKLALFCSITALVGCSSTGNESNDAASLGAPGTINIGSAERPYLEPLPDIEYSPSNGNNGGGRVEETDGGGTDDSMMVDSPPISEGMSAESASDPLPTSVSASLDGGSSDSTGEFAGDMDSDGISLTSKPYYPDEQFQAGTLTAADYDDQLNPHLYQRYASDFLQANGGALDMPYLDLSKRIALHVKDKDGKAYGGVKLQITDGDNEVVALTSPASGTSYLYTNIDALPEQFDIRATGLSGTALDQSINLADATKAGEITIALSESQTPVAENQNNTVLDVMFVVDTTGSMGDELNYLQTELTPIINAIPYDKNLLNIGLTFYRDEGDEYVVRSHELTGDIAAAQKTLNGESYDGGGDYPEAMDQALQSAVNANWTENSKRILFLIADAPPHSNKMRATWDSAAQARLKNIHLVPIAASGVGADAEYLMRSIAAFTNSRYLFLTDDSGYGNPHAEPTVDCYVVTQLNNLMERVLNSLITGVRDEPTDNDIVRRVGNYDGGVCNPDAQGQ